MAKTRTHRVQGKGTTPDLGPRHRPSEVRHGKAISKLPSEHFHNNIRVTFIRDRTGILAREVIGLETMMWGNDFPHHVSTWPNSQSVLDQHFADTPPEVRQAICRDNCRDLYGF